MTKRDDGDDRLLIERIIQQDQNALTELYDRYSAVVYSLAYQTLNNVQLAEEVTQDTFLKVWRKPQNWDPERGRFSSWLLTVARYTAIDRLRSERKHTSTHQTPLDEAPEAPSEIGLPGNPIWENGQLLRKLLAELPVEQAEVIRLAFFQGLSHSEIAEKR